MISILDFANYFIFFLIIHCIADFPLQGDFIANMKGKNNYILFVHSVIWAGLISIGLNYFGLLSQWNFMFLLFGHYYIDKWKTRKEDKTYALTYDLYKDQALHFLQIGLVILF